MGNSARVFFEIQERRNLLKCNFPLTARANGASCPITKIEKMCSVFLPNYKYGTRTEWSSIRSVIIPVITKSGDRAAGVRFVYHEYDHRLNWTTRSLITNQS